MVRIKLINPPKIQFFSQPWAAFDILCPRPPSPVRCRRGRSPLVASVLRRPLGRLSRLLFGRLSWLPFRIEHRRPARRSALLSSARRRANTPTHPQSSAVADPFGPLPLIAVLHCTAHHSSSGLLVCLLSILH